MRSVEQPLPARGNPGASRCWGCSPRQQRRRVRPGAHASAANARRAPSGHGGFVGSAGPPHGGVRAVLRRSTRARSSAGRDRSGCTAAPARGSGCTGTSGQNAPLRHSTSALMAEVLDAPTCAVQHCWCTHRRDDRGVGHGAACLCHEVGRCRVRLMPSAGGAVVAPPHGARRVAYSVLGAITPCLNDAASPGRPPCRAACRAGSLTQPLQKPCCSKARPPPPELRAF
jgi:hypothetical protein